MPIRIVQSKQNARLKELRRALAAPGRKAPGSVGIEGPHLLEEALRAGLQLRCIFAEERMQHWVGTLKLPAETEVLIVPPGLLSAILSTETPQPVAALVDAPEWTWDNLLNATTNPLPLVVILAGIQDPGNLGTIVRSAEAFGATGIICLPGTVNPWNPKALRASAGSLLRMPLLSVSEDDALQKLRHAGLRLFTTAVHGAQPVSSVNLATPVALLIGNEGNGVPSELAKKADLAITIPCPGPVESLNAAIAASVLLYEASRQRAVNHTRKQESGGSH